jgi:serine/threonine-protein kinase HipA
MAYRPVDLIEVRCWDTTVGAVAYDPSSGFYAFEYDPAWAARGVELAPIMMPVAGRAGAFIFPGLAERSYHRLAPLVADSLPDSFGNAIVTAYLATEGVSADKVTALDRLAYLGNRGIGALEFRPVRGPRPQKPTAIELSDLVVAARSALNGEIGTGPGATSAISELLAVGTSAGGARAKAVVALNPSTGELRSGQLPADPGFEYWLLKLDGVGRDLDLGASGHYGRTEYTYHQMAVMAGIEMTECRLLEEERRAHFMTRRFDRLGSGEKIHSHTLCAMAGLDFRLIGAHDYAQLFMTIDRLHLHHEARRQAFLRMAFNVAAANCDDHTKNFSFLLPKQGGWRLSPAYDVTHAYAPTSQWTAQHLMSVNGRFAGITRADLVEVADRFQVPAAADGIDHVLAAVAQWAGLAADNGVPVATIRSISADIDLSSAPLR